MHQKPSQHKSKNVVFNENSTLFRFKSDCLIEMLYRSRNDPKMTENILKLTQMVQKRSKIDQKWSQLGT